jgi:hypothetical protein
MSKRRTIRGYKLTHVVITHYLDDHLPVGGMRGFLHGDLNPGNRQLFPRILCEGKSDQAIFELLFAPHHGSALAGDMIPEPPKLAEFFMLLLPMKYGEELVGCAEEEYWSRSLPRLGARKARVIFWAQMIHAWLIFLARPFAGIAGLAWVGKVVEAILSKLLK